MKRAEILEQARKCVCGEREREYGRPENNFALIGKLWEAYTGMRYSAKDVAMMLALLKVARIKTGVKGDRIYGGSGNGLWRRSSERIRCYGLQAAGSHTRYGPGSLLPALCDSAGRVP